MKKRVLRIVALIMVLSVFSNIVPLPVSFENAYVEQVQAKKKTKYTKAQKKLAADLGYYAGEYLKYPKSFKIESIYKVKIKPTESYLEMLEWAAQSTSGMTIKRSDYTIIWEIDYKAKNSYGTYVSGTVYIDKGGLPKTWDELYDDLEEGNYVDTEKLDLTSFSFQKKVKTLTKKYIKQTYY